MPLFALHNELVFPPVDLAEPDGLLAMGGDLSPERLLLAYRNGIFPWFEGVTPLWWSPDPRMILRPREFKVSLSLKKTLKRVLRDDAWEIRVDEDFAGVMRACAMTPRHGQRGTGPGTEPAAAGR